MRSATPCCVSSLTWLQFVGKRQKAKANHLVQFPVDHDIGKCLPFGMLAFSIPTSVAVTGVHITVSCENLIIYVWSCKSSLLEISKMLLFILLLNSFYWSFLHKLCLSDSTEYQHPSITVGDLLWPFFWDSISKKTDASGVQLFFFTVVPVSQISSLNSCRPLLSDSLVICTMEAAGSCMDHLFVV